MFLEILIIIIFDYNSGTSGFIDPKSIYLSYKVTTRNINAADGHIVGCPLYTLFLQIDTIINSQTIEKCIAIESSA